MGFLKKWLREYREEKLLKIATRMENLQFSHSNVTANRMDSMALLEIRRQKLLRKLGRGR